MHDINNLTSFSFHCKFRIIGHLVSLQNRTCCNKKYIFTISVIYNFNASEEYKLKLNVGESVHILQEEENWYYGYSLSNQKIKGVFPKTYVKIIECTIDREGIIPVFLLKRPIIVHEITIVLREWGMHWKRLYVVSVRRFLFLFFNNTRVIRKIASVRSK